MNKAILPDTSLCAIVRDEIENPAGGIVDFVDSTLPFVEAGIIIDTGSVDGTREKLEELSLKYSSLKIYDRQFDDYSSSRNFSLSKAETERVLVLDADERLTTEDFENLKCIIEENSKKGYNFTFYNVYPNGVIRFPRAHNPRLFRVSEKTHYKQNLWEVLFLGDLPFLSFPEETLKTGIAIKHFLSSGEAMEKKQEWYARLSKHYNHLCLGVKILENIRPEISESKMWKAYNPKRERYK